MADHRLIVVGTDGSETSLRAVDRAAAIAAESSAKLIIASAHLPEDRDGASEPDQPDGEGYRTEGGAPVYAMLRDARLRAESAGATDVEERPVVGAPVDALVALVDEVGADLLVVGNLGEGTITGKLFGSVPSAVRKKAATEVLVVDTAD